MLDATHARTHENLLLGEGLLLRCADGDALLSAADPAAALAEALDAPGAIVGVTRAGCVFRCAPRMIDLTRGQRTPMAGELLQGPWEATLSGTLLEITPENAAMLLNLPLPDDGAPVPTVLPENCGDVCWVGVLGRGLLAIRLSAPVSTDGLTLSILRGGLGEMAFTLRAQQRSAEDAALPCRIVWLREVEA